MRKNIKTLAFQHPAVARQQALANRLNGPNLAPSASLPTAESLEVEVPAKAALPAATPEASEYDASGTFTDFGAPWHGTPATLESALRHYAAYDAAKEAVELALPQLPDTPTPEQKRAYSRAKNWLSIRTDSCAFHDTSQAAKIQGFYLEARHHYSAMLS